MAVSGCRLSSSFFISLVGNPLGVNISISCSDYFHPWSSNSRDYISGFQTYNHHFLLEPILVFPDFRITEFSYFRIFSLKHTIIKRQPLYFTAQFRYYLISKEHSLNFSQRNYTKEWLREFQFGTWSYEAVLSCGVISYEAPTWNSTEKGFTLDKRVDNKVIVSYNGSCVI